MQPFRMSALEMLRAYRRRALSPVEAMASVIERVEAYEPHIHATWLYAPERALKEARASEARWAKGEPIGPARRRAGHNQGQYRDPRRPEAHRYGGGGHDAAAVGRPARGAAA